MGYFVGWATWWLLGLLAVLLLSAWIAWERVEEELRHRLAAFVSKKLGGIKVSLGLLKIRHWGLEFRDVEVGNSPGEFSAPYFLRLKLLRVTVDGVLNLLSLPGIMRIGPTWRFALGSSRRIIETIDMEGLDVHVEEKKVEGEPPCNNAGAFEKIRAWQKNKRLRRLGRIRDKVKEWKAKWEVEVKEGQEEASSPEKPPGSPPEVGESKEGREEEKKEEKAEEKVEEKAQEKSEKEEEKEEMEEEGEDLLDEEDLDHEGNDSPDGMNSTPGMRSERLRDRIMTSIHNRRTNSLIFNVPRRLSEATTTQIGRWTCKDFTVDMKGHVVTLGDEGWELRGFVGSDLDLAKVLSATLLSKLARDAYSNRREFVKESISNLKEKAGNLVGRLAGGLQRRAEQNQQNQIGGGGDESPEREAGSSQERSRPGAGMLRARFAGMLRRNKDIEEKEVGASPMVAPTAAQEEKAE